MNKTTLIVSAFLIGLVATIVFLARWKNNEGSSASHSNDATTVISSNPSNTDWVSKATTVNELTLESDLVVRARVSKAPVTRVLRQVVPVWDEKGNIVDSAVEETLFSDTVFEVLRTYRGKSSSQITVAQTGGFDPAISNGIEEVADDPLYKIGEEYVLFLVDISGDPVQAPDRELYRIVNPFGRYKIEDKNVFSYSQNVKSVQLPTNITELETQIQLAASMPTKLPIQTPLPTP